LIGRLVRPYEYRLCTILCWSNIMGILGVLEDRIVLERSWRVLRNLLASLAMLIKPLVLTSVFIGFPAGAVWWYFTWVFILFVSSIFFLPLLSVQTAGRVGPLIFWGLVFSNSSSFLTVFLQSLFKVLARSFCAFWGSIKKYFFSSYDASPLSVPGLLICSR